MVIIIIGKYSKLQCVQILLLFFQKYYIFLKKSLQLLLCNNLIY